MLPSTLRQVSPDKTRTGRSRFAQHHAHCRSPSQEEMRAVFQMCRGNQWNSVLNSIRSNRLIQTTNMTMDNNITTTIIHQAITSKGDITKRAMVIQEILQVTPYAASIKNGYGSLPLHVICQRNVKMNSAKKERLIRHLINAYPMSLTVQGGVGKRTPLHIIFTDYVSVGVTELMIRRGMGACFMTDKNGFLPAHVACSRHCSPEKLDMLLQVNPASLFEKSKDGRTLLDLARCKATKSHPNYALITDIERRLNMACLDRNPISFDSATDSIVAANSFSPFLQEGSSTTRLVVKRENDSAETPPAANNFSTFSPAGEAPSPNNFLAFSPAQEASTPNNFSVFSTAQASTPNTFLPISQQMTRIKHENHSSSEPTTTTTTTSSSSSTNNVSPFAQGISRIKRENDSSDEDSRKKKSKQDDSDPANLLLHFSRHMENITSV